ncbi:tigger transposable element-derived protein 6-like [Coccinella septempunctata]|uniref:tigger transposable element-derived protein 6-like n=1 Tax=Coccinella septempunctata TaxID=41139 RepID=UPI001D083EF1|nr:tigger transposable element-derived protein 6-like [Coccinella septempunctata]
MAPRKKLLSLGEKMEVINTSEKENLSVRKLAEKFSIGKTQAAEIIKNKNNIRLVKAKAQEIAEKSNVANFRASNGWLEKWRKRHAISFKCISGESADVSQEDVNQFKIKLPSLLLGYRPEDVYNADETGLFFRALPEKTLAFRSEKCIGGKLSKERLTILFCANMAGQKEDMLVIGKAARPRAFKNVPMKDLPVMWKFNKKAWMTQDIMSEWLLKFDLKMRKQKRKILLFLDNAGSHPREVKLQNIKVIFLPPNTTSMCQPLDQGIIQNFKFFYRGSILKHILSKMDQVKSASELAKSINVLEALYYMKTAWNKVSSATIQNCFRKAGFHKSNGDTASVEWDSEDYLPLSTIAQMEGCAKEMQISQENLESYVGIDDITATEEITFNLDEAIENMIDQQNSPDEKEDSDLELDTVENNNNSITSCSQALKVINDLKIFANDDYIAFQHLKNLEDHYQSKIFKQKMQNMRQSSILEFINK